MVIVILLPLCIFTTNTLGISSVFPSAPPQEKVTREKIMCYSFYCVIFYRLKVFHLLKCLSNKL